MEVNQNTLDDAKISQITADDLFKDDVHPDVNREAIDAVKSEKESQKNIGVTVGQNVKLKKDGTPANKRGRKPKDQAHQSTAQKSKVFGQDQKEEIKPNVSSEHAAFVVSGILERMQCVLISDDFIYTEQEKIANVTAWAKTFDYYGGVNISPPQALILDHMGIILSRASKPKTIDKITALRVWLSSKLSKIKFWDKKNARTDSRADSKREDDIRKEESEKSKK